MSDSSPLQEIPALGYLSEVSAEDRQFLTSYGKFIRPADGECVITEGEAQDALYLILSGTLHVTSTSGVRPMLLASLGAGDSMGEVNLFDPANASANVISRGASMIWCLSRSELDSLFEVDPNVGISVMKGLMRKLSERIRHMNKKLISSEHKAGLHNHWDSSAS